MSFTPGSNPEKIEQRDVPTLKFSEEELAAQRPKPETVAKGIALFRQYGALRIERAIPIPYLDELEAFYRKRYWAELEKTKKEDLRPLFTVYIEGPFNRPEFYANPMFFPIVKGLLGDDCILGACSSVVSFPGAPNQFIHRDTDSLFGDYGMERELPPYALTVLMPLIDADLMTGTTDVWPCTHLEPVMDKATALPPVHPVVTRGNVMMTDSRVVHRGGENKSDRIRPLVYNSYHRHWFRDFGGYLRRPPIAIHQSELKKVPDEHKAMFTWRFDRYRKMQFEADARRVVRDLLPRSLRSRLTKLQKLD